VAGGPSAIAARQLAHAVLYITSQTRQGVAAAIRKHHRNLFQVVTDYIHGVKFCTSLICELGSHLSSRRGRRSKVCCQQHSIQANLAMFTSVFHEIMLWGTYRQHRTWRLCDDLFGSRAPECA